VAFEYCVVLRVKLKIRSERVVGSGRKRMLLPSFRLENVFRGRRLYSQTGVRRSAQLVDKV
jgi:hypothetical protein